MSLKLPTNRRFDVIGVGRNSWDRIALVSRYPLPDRKTDVIEITNQSGGQVATTLVAATRMGANTRYLGKFGDDAGGRAVRGALVRENIDLSECRVISGVANQSAFIVVDQESHTRNVFSHFDPRLAVDPDDFSQEAITSARILFVGGRSPATMAPFAKLGREAGCVVVVDADDASEGAVELLSSAHVVICPSAFPRQFSGEKALEKAIQDIGSLGPDIVCCTRGARGSLTWAEGRFIKSRGFSVNVIDTTGAGDVFQGAFLVGLLSGDPLDEILQFSNAAAALKCRTLGGQSGIPPRADVEKFLQM